MGSLSYQVPAGLDIGDYVTFVPKSVVVSNYSPFYIYLPDALSYCSPWTSGAIFPLAHATRARAIWTQSPFGPQTVNIPVGVTYAASITFTDADLPLSGGTALANPFNPAKILSGYGGNTAAGVHVVGTIPTASVIRILTITVAGTNVAGTAGIVTLRLSDNIGGVVELASLLLVSPSQDNTAISYVDPLTITQLDTTVPVWYFQLVQGDITNLGLLSWWTSIVYN